MKQAFTLNGVSMRTASVSDTSEVSGDTVFVFKQIEDVFSASYRGGAIIDGYLIGRLQPDGALEFRYVQADTHGNLDAGVSKGSLSRLADGRLRITENFQWITRAGSGQNIFEEIAA